MERGTRDAVLSMFEVKVNLEVGEEIEFLKNLELLEMY